MVNCHVTGSRKSWIRSMALVFESLSDFIMESSQLDRFGGYWGILRFGPESQGSSWCLFEH